MSTLGVALLEQLDGDDVAELRRRLGIPSEREPDPIEHEAMLTPGAAAERLNVNVETIRRAVRSGALSAVRVGRQLRISPRALDEWLAGDRRPSTSARRSRPPRPRSRRSPMRDALVRLEKDPE